MEYKLKFLHIHKEVKYGERGGEQRGSPLVTQH